MRIRLFVAFASNNSGSYTMVGRFADAATADDVARLVEELCVEHAAWNDAHDQGDDLALESPLDRFVAREGLRAVKPGRGDDWPQHGPPPRVIATGHQILLHAPYTASLSPVFGELIYARGGRVDVELDHAHERVAVELGYWGGFEAEEASLDAFEAELAAALPTLAAPDPHDSRPAIAPVFHRGSWGARQLTAVFRDVIEAMRAIRALAGAHGVDLDLRVRECPGGVADPLALLRASGAAAPRGVWTVILWQVGADRIAVMKAVRQLRGCGLQEARDALAELPLEVVVDVAEAFARDGAAALVAAGADAEAVMPRP
ncbi:MAG: ribosomal protein L7/L12 [Kofleriaceae bacterium]|nr:ribosomal protein L7/L12 [Kofleriaceae bacterium]MCB9573906.1 ribosomal protein L7/L12 [Kofleriaceae bacterium]